MCSIYGDEMGEACSIIVDHGCLPAVAAGNFCYCVKLICSVMKHIYCKKKSVRKFKIASANQRLEGLEALVARVFPVL